MKMNYFYIRLTNTKFSFPRYPSSRSSTVKSYAVTNLYPETTIRDTADRSGTIPSRSTLHSLRYIDNNHTTVGRNRNDSTNSQGGLESRGTSRPSLFSRNPEPDLTSFKTVDDDDYGFRSQFSSPQV